MHFSRFSFFLLKENPFFFSSMPVAFFNLLLTLFWVGGRNKGIRGWLLQIYKLNAKKGWFFLEPLLCCVPHLCSFKSLLGYFSVPGRFFFCPDWHWKIQGPNQQRTLNKLPPELRCRNFEHTNRRQMCKNVYATWTYSNWASILHSTVGGWVFFFKEGGG